MAVVSDRVVAAHPASPALRWFDMAGRCCREVRLEGLLEPLRILPTSDGLWIADAGSKRRVHGPEFETQKRLGRMVCIDADGRIFKELREPGDGWYPTSIALARESEDIWIADGYCRHLVHQFNRRGGRVQTLTGEEGAGRSSWPDGVLIDVRRISPELYVSDRAPSSIRSRRPLPSRSRCRDRSDAD